MSDNEDHELHELVRNALNQQRPSYEEAHWMAMQQKLREKPRRPYGYWLAGLALLLLVGSLFILTQKNGITEKTITSVETSNAETPTEQQTPNVTSEAVTPTQSETKAAEKRPLRYPFAQEPMEIAPSDQNRRLADAFTEIVSLKMAKPFPVSEAAINLNAPIEREIRRRLEQKIVGPDSVTSQALERNKSNWRNVAIVCDFTSSMYPHATELFTWLDRNRRNRYIKGAVFFTDCDSLGHETRPNGLPGKMFVVKDWQNTDVLPIFIEASRNTMGNSERAENDLEAIIHAQKSFPGIESFVLIADNSSPVKDMALLSQIKKPVHVVICGVTYEPKVAIQPDYLTIAAATKGSVHTLNQDLPDVAKIKPGTKLQVGKNWYKYRKGRFVLRNPNGFWRKK
jgi:hypothetical protein